ncbi:BURP domain-containing protein 3-like [Triticum urartu]|uniref:BURP domain-containing protein 3-like n=1 Tax=Triticum urartu TaxID=4572 RepID=UPI002044A236|nr:BURP domain-containing protein 3-like [Triticum urartu]XP_048543999.1 BURP domain-containing protein 3-like [Triticum urartu]
MGRLLASLLCFLLVASVEHAAGAPTPEQYWKSALPDTPMPSSLSQLLNTSSASVGEHRKPRGIAVGIWAFHYFDHYDATETHLLHMTDDPAAALFFLEKDLRMHTSRRKLTKVLHFMATSGAGERFLPRSEAGAIPFSSGEVPEILSRFSVMPDSVEAAEMARTLHVCEAPAAEGEKKWCATSLESMVDFTTSSLGTSHVRAVSTVVGKEGTPSQEYTLTGVKRAGTDQLVVCHAEPYAYAVFACHLTRATRAYTLSMVGEDGTAVEAVAVCHADTAGWNPRHIAFQVLNVKPGTVPVCHLVPQDHVVWTRSLTFASYLYV